VLLLFEKNYVPHESYTISVRPTEDIGKIQISKNDVNKDTIVHADIPVKKRKKHFKMTIYDK
jgi:hypothetical protein